MLPAIVKTLSALLLLPLSSYPQGIGIGFNNIFTQSESTASLNLKKECAQKCKIYSSVSVCFVGKSIEPYTLGNSIGSCGGAEIVSIVSSPENIVDELTKVASACKKVSRMVLYGHSDSSNIDMGSILNSSDWKNLSPHFSCVFANNAEIDVRGCNIGNGCDGQRQMYNIARAFLGDKSGSILAPTSYARGDLSTALVKVRSQNGKDRTMKYRGLREEPIFGYEGLLLSTPTANQVCIDELKSLQDRLKQFDRILNRKKCSRKTAEVEALENYRTLFFDSESVLRGKSVKMLPEGQSISRYSLAIEKAAIKAISTCLKDNYRHKLSTSTNAEDQKYLKELDQTDDARTSSPTRPNTSTSSDKSEATR